MSNHIALICAAGIGERMKSVVPKQYLQLIYQQKSQTILEITTQKFLENPSIDACILALNPQDQLFAQLQSAWVSPDTSIDTLLNQDSRTLFPTNDLRLYFCIGLGLRYHAVYSLVINALELCKENNWDPNDTFIYIHDCARPGIQQADINHLIQATSQLTNPCAYLQSASSQVELDPEQASSQVTTSQFIGGILPINRAVDSIRTISPDQQHQLAVTGSLDRNSISLALTPQVFNLGYYSFVLNQVLELGKDQIYLADLANSSKYARKYPEFFKFFPILEQLGKNSLGFTKFLYNKGSSNLDLGKFVTQITDDVGIVLQAQDKVIAIELGKHNLKITTPEDLALAQFYLDLEAKN